MCSEPYAFVLEKTVMDKTATGGSNFHLSSALQSSGLKHALFTVSTIFWILMHIVP